ncbi:MAG TPA: AAA family ATPase [Solirubrobacterales bacterium]|jgi:class 3 adenylate cyclase/tetratricopeptide (TPR) repeat protein|nr:AAA family ATPase [Solirubrobacterales bacterium]HTK89355.1 AAA family ATPase [Verrucomicrobiae bacterium]
MDEMAVGPAKPDLVACSSCGHLHPTTTRFCDQCGTPQGRLCQECGGVNAHTAKFCSGCGAPLVTKAAPEAAPAAPALNAYTPAYLADKILTTRSALEGERKQVTVLFVDVADSSLLAQRIDVESLHRLMGEVLQLVAEAVHRYEGTVNQYLGDGLMALFGAPFAVEDHPLRAVQAALAIQETIRGYGAQVRRDHGVELRLRVGLNTGSVVVGRIGDDLRMDYTAVGNTTHIAFRMQVLAEPGAILMAEETHRFVEGYVFCESLGPVAIKGQREQVTAYRISGRRRWRSRLEMSAARGLTQFAGRRRELALLHDCLKRVEAGHGQIVGIVGEPGLGKSRLLYEVHASLPEDRFNWLEGHCMAYGRSLPYGPVLDMIRAQFHVEEGDNPLQIQDKLRDGVQRLDPGLEALLPFLEALFALPGADDALRHLDRAHRRQQTLEAVRAVFVAASQKRPVILVCENLHWIDQSSEDLLAFLAGSLSGVPILILTTHRTGYTMRWADKPHYTQIALDGLARSEIEDMLTTLLNAPELPPELLQFIGDKADGNPLFIEEIIQALLERGLLVLDGEHPRLISDAMIEWPATIHDVIQARIDRLDDAVKDTVQLAAIIGRQFELRLLTRVSGLSGQITSHIETLKRLDVIHEARFFPRLEYCFKHVVIQDVIYKSLLAPRRHLLHGVVARTIEELCADQLDENAVVLAYHYSRSDHYDDAIKYALRAGDRAARVYANAEAGSYYDQALTLTRTLPSSPERLGAEIDVCLKRASVGSTREALEQDRVNLEGARGLAESLGDEVRLARVLYWLGRLAYVRGAFGIATGYAEQSLLIADRLADEDLSAPPVNLTGRCYYLMGDYAPAGELLARSVEQMRQLGNSTEEATAAGFAGVALAALGDFERALAYANHGLELAAKLRNPFVLAAAYNYRAVAYCHQGEGPQAIQDCEDARRVAERAGDRFRLYLLRFYEGQAHAMMGEPGRGRELLEQSIGIAKQLGTTTLLAWGQGLLATCLLALGEHASLLPLCEETIRLAAETHDRLARSLAHRTLAEALAVIEPSEVDRAERAILDAIHTQRELGARPELARSYVVYTRLLLRWARAEEAAKYRSEAIAMFRSMRMSRDLAAIEREESAPI